MSRDQPLERAIEQVEAVIAGRAAAPHVQAFFHEPTFTVSYIVADEQSARAAVVDSVLDFCPAACRTSTGFAAGLAAFVEAKGLTVDWLLETHTHADHLSAAAWLQQRLGGRMAIGKAVTTVQSVFGKLFNEGTDFARDGSQFDRLFADGDRFEVGGIPAIALEVPGHTPADMAFVIGDSAFVGDTMFMPDYGTARADFPGGDARRLYRSIRRLLRLPDSTRVFVCHDYKAPPARTEFAWETTIGAQRTGNLHVREGVSEEAFVEMRTRRDATLPMPKLILPSVQVNMRAGRLPEPADNGTRYLKLPLDLF